MEQPCADLCVFAIHFMFVVIVYCKLYIYRKNFDDVKFFGGGDKDDLEINNSIIDSLNKRVIDPELIKNRTKFKNKQTSKIYPYDTKIKIKQFLTSQQRITLNNNYPELDIEFTNKQKEMHAFAHASRILERRTMLNMLQINGYKSNKSKIFPDHTFELCDVGGRVHQNINDKLETVHVESPILSARDYSRVLNDFNIVDKLNIRSDLDKLKGTEEMKSQIGSCIKSCNNMKLKLKENVNKDFVKLENKIVTNDDDYWCFSPSQFCKSTAKNLMFLHSIYDMTPQMIIDIFKVKQAKFGAATVLYDFNIFDPDTTEGVIESQDCQWKKDVKNDEIRFWFINDPSHLYKHKLSNYISLFNPRFIDNEKKIVLMFEIINIKCGIAFIKYTVLDYCRVDFEPEEHVLQSAVNKNFYKINYFVPVRDHMGKYSRVISRRSLKVDKAYFDNVFSEVLRADNGRFTITTVINILTTFNKQIMINGTDIVQKSQLSSESNFELAHALYILAFVKKYEMHFLCDKFVSEIKYIRELNSNSILKIFYYKILCLFSYIPMLKNFISNQCESFIVSDSLSYSEEFLLDVLSVTTKHKITYSSLVSEILIGGSQAINIIPEVINLNVKNTDDSKEEQSYIDGDYCCEMSFNDVIDAGGDGNCGPLTIQYLLKYYGMRDVEISEIRRQVYEYLKFLGDTQDLDCINDKVFVSCLFMRVCSLIYGFNLCLHLDTEINTRVKVMNDENYKTFHIHFGQQHFSPVITKDRPVVIKNVLKQNIFVKSEESELLYLQINLLDSKGGSGLLLEIFSYIVFSMHFRRLFNSFSKTFVFLLIIKFFFVIFAFLSSYSCFYYISFLSINMILEVVVFIEFLNNFTFFFSKGVLVKIFICVKIVCFFLTSSYYCYPVILLLINCYNYTFYIRLFIKKVIILGFRVFEESIAILVLAVGFVFLIVVIDSFVKSFYVVEVTVPETYYQNFRVFSSEWYYYIKSICKDFDYLKVYNNIHHSLFYSCIEVTSIFGYTQIECRERHFFDITTYFVYNLFDKIENLLNYSVEIISIEEPIVEPIVSQSVSIDISSLFFDVLCFIINYLYVLIVDILIPIIRFVIFNVLLVFFAYLLQQYFNSVNVNISEVNKDFKSDGDNDSNESVLKLPLVEIEVPRVYPINFKIRMSRFKRFQYREMIDSVYDLSYLFIGDEMHDTENTVVEKPKVLIPTLKAVNRRVIEMRYDLFELIEKINDKDSLIVAHCVSADFKMSAGIAKTFVKNFKNIKDQLEISGTVPDLQIVQSRSNFDDCQYMIAHLVTKLRYSGKPTLNTLRQTISLLFTEIREMDSLNTLVIPKLGCGLDKLEWCKVKGIIEEHLSSVNRDFTVVICEYEPVVVMNTPDVVVETEPKTVESDLNLSKEEKILNDYTSFFKLDKNYLWLPAISSTETIDLKDLRDAFNHFAVSYKKKFKQSVKLITSYNHEIEEGKNFYCCLSCVNINECPYVEEFGYTIHNNSYLTDKLVNVDEILSKFCFRFVPYSCDYELAYNSILEKFLINILTKDIIEKEMKSLNTQIRNNLESTFEKKIKSVRELKENKNLIISVYDAVNSVFLTRDKFYCEKAIDCFGDIVDVEIKPDNNFVFKRNVNRVEDDDGIYIFCNRIEIFNEPVIIPKQLIILKNFVINYYTPLFNLINGVPGCGKTTRTIRDFKPDQKFLIVTATRDAAKDVRNRLSKLFDVDSGISISVYNKLLLKYVRTIDSVLVNENRLFIENLFVDEALMQHAGDVYSLIVLCNPRVVNLVGDVAQIPFVNRIASYVTLYQKFPFKISERLYTSYRCPVDVMLAISKSYDSGVFSASKITESLEYQLINVVSEIDFCALNEKEGSKQIIVFKQAEKLTLSKLLKQMNIDINVNTVHEFQGQQASHVYIIRLSDRIQEEVYQRNAYALVAISRHTVSCKYWTFCPSDAIVKLMLNAKRNVGGAYTTAVEIQKQQNRVFDNEINNNNRSCLVELETKYVNYIHDLQRSDGINGLIDLTVELARGYNIIDKEFVDTDKTSYTHTSSAYGYLNESIYDINAVKNFDPSLLQMEFDRILPRNAVSDLAGTAMLLQHSDLSLNLDNVRIRGKFMSPVDIYKHDNRTLKPVLKTSCPINRVETMQEILLGIQKRNSNVPEMQGLVDAQHNANAIYKDFIRTFIDPRKYHILADYKQSRLGASKRNVLQWFDLSSFKPSYLYNDFYIDILSAEFNRFTYSIKPQPKPVQTYNASVTYQPLQTISAHKRYLNSQFCPIIKEFKARLTSVLKKKYHIFTDESNADFVKNLNTFCNPGLVHKLLMSDELFIKELDISKYDKSQGAEALLFCCALMTLFGISQDIVDYYFKCNLLNYLKCGTYGISFTVNYQMKSGTAPTLIFNTLFTMAVNGLVYDDVFVYYACFCGDDATFFLSTKIKKFLKDFDTSQFTSALLNLETKELSFKYTYFCSRFMLASNNSWYVVADPVKLLNKLGRSDILDFAHAEEYRVSACDNFQVKNNEVLYLLNFAVSERYNVPTSNVNLIKMLQICLSNQELFKSLFYKPSNYVEPKGFFRASIKF